jgi:hypothetical protein
MAKWSVITRRGDRRSWYLLASKWLKRTTNDELPASDGQAPAQEFSITFGNPAEPQMFAREYSGFLIEWHELQEFIKAVMLNRTIHPPDIEPLTNLPDDDDPLILEAEDRYRADISSFMMARIAVDDFSELLTLASNGWVMEP